jgi:hypothetical protein
VNSQTMIETAQGMIGELIDLCDDVAAGIGPGRDNGAAEVVLAKRKLQEARYWLGEAVGVLVTRASIDMPPPTPQETAASPRSYLFPESEGGMQETIYSKEVERDTNTLVRRLMGDDDELRRLADELTAKIDADRERARQQQKANDAYDRERAEVLTELPNSKRERGE